MILLVSGDHLFHFDPADNGKHNGGRIMNVFIHCGLGCCHGRSSLHYEYINIRLLLYASVELPARTLCITTAFNQNGSSRRSFCFNQWLQPSQEIFGYVGMQILHAQIILEHFLFVDCREVLNANQSHFSLMITPN